MLPMIPLSIETSLAGAVRLGLVAANGIRTEAAGDALLAEIAALTGRLAREHAGVAPAEIPGLAPARALYRTFGVDPTRTRPSSEALLRRIVQGKPFPCICGPVDLCNLCAVRFLLPIGLYDLAKISGAVTLRRGGPGDGYEGIRKDRVNLEGRPALFDATGPFGNPTSDSARTCVTPATRSLLFVIFAPASCQAAELREHVRFTAEAIERLIPPAGTGESARAQVETSLLPDPESRT